MTIIIKRIQQRRAMFEVYIMSLCVLSGLAGAFIPDTRSQSIVVAFPLWSQIIWYFGLIVGGSVSLCGVIIPRVDVGLTLERAALWLIAGLCASFGISLLNYAGVNAVLTLPMTMGFAGISIARIFQINSDLKLIANVIAEMPVPSRL